MSTRIQVRLDDHKSTFDDVSYNWKLDNCSVCQSFDHISSSNLHSSCLPPQSSNFPTHLHVPSKPSHLIPIPSDPKTTSEPTPKITSKSTSKATTMNSPLKCSSPPLPIAYSFATISSIYEVSRCPLDISQVSSGDSDSFVEVPRPVVSQAAFNPSPWLLRLLCRRLLVPYPLSPRFVGVFSLH